MTGPCVFDPVAGRLWNHNADAIKCDLLNFEQEAGRLIAVNEFKKDKSWVEKTDTWDALCALEDGPTDQANVDHDGQPLGYCVGIYAHEITQSTRTRKGKSIAMLGSSVSSSKTTKMLRVVIPQRSNMNQLYVLLSRDLSSDRWITGQTKMADVFFFQKFRDDLETSKQKRSDATSKLMKTLRQGSQDDSQKAVEQSSAIDLSSFPTTDPRIGIRNMVETHIHNAIRFNSYHEITLAYELVLEEDSRFRGPEIPSLLFKLASCEILDDEECEALTNVAAVSSLILCTRILLIFSQLYWNDHRYLGLNVSYTTFKSFSIAICKGDKAIPLGALRHMLVEYHIRLENGEDPTIDEIEEHLLLRSGRDVYALGMTTRPVVESSAGTRDAAVNAALAVGRGHIEFLQGFCRGHKDIYSQSAPLSYQNLWNTSGQRLDYGSKLAEFDGMRCITAAESVRYVEYVVSVMKRDYDSLESMIRKQSTGSGAMDELNLVLHDDAVSTLTKKRRRVDENHNESATGEAVDGPGAVVHDGDGAGATSVGKRRRTERGQREVDTNRLDAS